jgi:hypothetical protein
VWRKLEVGVNWLIRNRKAKFLVILTYVEVKPFSINQFFFSCPLLYNLIVR